MKKIYKEPLMEIVETELQCLICISGAGGSVTDFTSDDSWPDDTAEEEGD